MRPASFKLGTGLRRCDEALYIHSFQHDYLLGHFSTSYRMQDRLLEQLTLIKAEQIAVLASENPELRMYQIPRIED